MSDLRAAAHCRCRLGILCWYYDLTAYKERMEKYSDITLYKSLQESMQQRMIDSQSGLVMALSMD